MVPVSWLSASPTGSPGASAGAPGALAAWRDGKFSRVPLAGRRALDGALERFGVLREILEELQSIVVAEHRHPVGRGEAGAQPFDGVLAGADLALQQPGHVGAVAPLIVEKKMK
jgi:hypothetical protein